MKKPLSIFLNEGMIAALKKEIQSGNFKGISFEQAMQFILTDGIVPESDLPVTSFLKLEDWVRYFDKNKTFSYSATELKNKTGEILERVLQGNTIRLEKHGRVIAEIKPV